MTTNTLTNTKPATGSKMQETRQEVAVFQPPRLPFNPAIEERFGVDRATWRVLIDAIWPSAQSVDSIVLALSYCRARHLDPLKRPVHIVPVWSSSMRKMVDTVWPGISELRTTASRTRAYAGKDAAKFGPRIAREFTHSDKDGKTTSATVEFPEWCEVTVYRIVDGHRCAFVGPKVFWLEAYATKDRFSMMPNEMWADRASGQLEKCAEAAALRAAFPEELGNEYAAEEMWGKTINGSGPSDAAEPVSPVKPKRSDFKQAGTAAVVVTQAEAEVADTETQPTPETAVQDAAEDQQESAEDAEAARIEALLAEWRQSDFWAGAMQELADAKDDAAIKRVVDGTIEDLKTLIPDLVDREIVIAEWRIAALGFQKALSASKPKKAGR